MKKSAPPRQEKSLRRGNGMSSVLPVDRTTNDRTAKYDALMPLLTAMLHDFQNLVHKKPEGALSKKKIEIVNRLLNSLLMVLEEEPAREYLDLLNEEDVPQNSDVVLILGQFAAAMRSFHSKYWRSASIDDAYCGEKGWSVR
jgi:hypothetical protein